MNKRIIGLVLAGLIFVGGQVTRSYANENLNEEVQAKTEQARIQDGWVKIEYTEMWSYYKNGERLKNQWLKDNGKWYYLDLWGSMASNQTCYIDNKTYIFDKSGAIIEKKGWISLQNWNKDNDWYYGNGDGTVKTEQWIKDNGKWYYLDNKGRMCKKESYCIDNKYYMFDENGAMIEKEGWIYLKGEISPYDSGWYWGNGDGTIKTNSWVKYNNKWYYFLLEDDFMPGRMMHNGTMYIDKKLYVFDSNGEMIEEKGWIYLKDKINPYYSNWYWGNGDGTIKTSEWIQYGKEWYYVYYDGSMLKDGVSYIDGKKYIFLPNGICINPY